MITWFVAVDDS